MVWPRATKFGMITHVVQKPASSDQQRPRPNGRPQPQIFGTSYMCRHCMRYNKQILHGDQTRCGEGFSWLTTNADARSAVANLLVYVYVNICFLCCKRCLLGLVGSCSCISYCFCCLHVFVFMNELIDWLIDWLTDWLNDSFIYSLIKIQQQCPMDCGWYPVTLAISDSHTQIENEYQQQQQTKFEHKNTNRIQVNNR